MQHPVEWLNEQKIRRTIEALEKNNMHGYFVANEQELIEKIEEILPEGSKVSCGGSMSLFETGVIDYLRQGRYEFLDRYQEGLSPEEVNAIYRGAFSCDGYFASSNAITEQGELYNVDGNGNRVAAMLYGPDQVIVVAGVNKIVKDLDAAIKRNREQSAPPNAKRLNRATPCAKVGYCMDCKSPEKICREYTVIGSQMKQGRVHVIFLNKQLGY